MNILTISPDVMWEKELFLRHPSRELTREEVLSKEFKNTIKLMFYSLYENPIGVGLAAPQLGLPICLVVVDIKRDGKKPLVLINPRFEPLSEETEIGDETCLSFPNLAGAVQRYRRIVVKAKNMDFEDIEIEAEKFLARVCQHEIDHLNGIVYIDKSKELFVPNRAENVAEKAIKNLTES